MQLDPPLRLATPDDAPTLATLIAAASHGLAPYAWTMMAPPGIDPWTIGTGRQAERARRGDWVVVDEGAGAVAGLLAVPPETEPPGNDTPPVFHPLVSLETLSPRALYVNALATLPEARRRGHAARLLDVAEAKAAALGRSRLSLIVADTSLDARRLYDRSGFRPLASRPMVKGDWQGEGTTWHLLVKDLD
jgi:ribosomal protein S18 acetylase RimI-like enzyme